MKDRTYKIIEKILPVIIGLMLFTCFCLFGYAIWLILGAIWKILVEIVNIVV